MKENLRYGSVSVANDNRITGFFEKIENRNNYLVNGGVYIINRNAFESQKIKEKFSFEKDFIEKFFDKMKMYGSTFENFFLDIGVPEDFQLAQKEFLNLKY